MTTLTEAAVEQAALAWLESVGWQTAHGPDLGSVDEWTPQTIPAATPVVKKKSLNPQARHNGHIASPNTG